ncbi:Ig-like domain-containing protein [Paenibacillus sp. CGMCC 1.16610]|uniref:Probable pectate lyase C n=1 Tax=Paenibacillus anseongense TaxID=2682845 RepID=A0ABW9TZW9_9BACL|nr:MULTISPECIES: Ig-like domain-containing protein [Paenibacillus]MBA2936978.1 Ig-like domain-containing protein [Paenibacillus sp. CGMCC 1.16610]MVQ33303.1 hypothetical protein [Paenibacillus anseongense]
MIKFTKKWCSPALIFIMLFVATLGGNSEIAHAAGTSYYVDAVNGSDGNNGLSSATAWKSLSKINGTVFMPGDRILLKAGGVWTGQLYPKGSGTAGNPITIDQYGTGSKPLIQGGGLIGGAVYLNNQEYMVIQNLEVTNKSDTMVDGIAGILVEATDFGTLNSIKILNNYVHEVRGGYEGQNKYLGGIAVRALGSSVSTKFNDVLIEGNRVEDVSRTGIVTYSTWRKRPGVTNGNGAFSAWTNVVVRNNAVHLTFGDGILVTNTMNALIEYNVNSYANSNDLGLTNAGIWAWNADNTIIQYNEAYATQNTNDGQGFDIDFAQDGTIIQYNYSHDNEGGFVLICTDGSKTNTNGIVRYNISQNDLERVINVPGPVQNAKIYNNTIYVRPGLNPKIILHGDWGGFPDNTQYFNNIIVNHGSGGYKFSDSTNTKFDYNLFYGNHPATEPSDPHKLTSDPLMANPGTALDRDTVDGYLLKAGSPALNSGVLIASNGGKDYWGNPVSASAAPNRGAYNGAGITYSVPAPAPSVLTLFSDDFNDGNATGWNTAVGPAANWTIVNDGTPRYQGSAPDGDAMITSGQDWSNINLQARVKSSVIAAGGSVSLIARYKDLNNFYRFGYSQSTGTWNIWKKSSVAYTLLVKSVPFSYSLNTEYTVRAVLNGNNLSLQVDSGSGFVTVCSVTDNSLTTGLVGLLTYKSINTYDDVIVSPIVNNIGFNPTSYSVIAGSTVNPVVNATLSDNTTTVLTGGATYSSSNPGVAEVNPETGRIRGISAGSANITATYQGKTATAAVTVTPPPTPVSISLNPANYVVAVGTTVNTNVYANYSDNTTSTLSSGVAYASSNPNVAQVNATTGVVTGISTGSANITATYLGKTSTAPVTVALPLFSDNFNDGDAAGWNVVAGSVSSTSIVNDGTPRYQLSNSSETIVTAGQDWSDYSIQAKVKTPNITPGGSASLVARYKDINNFYRFSYNDGYEKWLIWKKLPGGLTLLGQSDVFSFSANTEYNVRAVLKGNNISLQVDSGSGFITLLSVTDNSIDSGKIGLHVYKNTSTFDDVIVSPLVVDSTPIPGIAIDQTALSLTAGDAVVKLNATVTNSTYTPVWTSSNPAVATVNSNGEVTPLAAGTAVITVTLANGIATAQCTVTVVSANQGGQPAMVLTGPSAVQVGQNVSVTLGINSLSTAVYAQDIAMSYDANLFEFVSANAVKNGVNIVKMVVSTPGTLRLILASTGTAGAVTGDTPLIELIFKAKNIQQSAAGNVTVTSAKLGESNGNEITAAEAVKSIEVRTNPIAIPGDITLDGKVSIGDLSMVAAHYGKNTASEDWAQVKAADVNDDGRIDIEDLTFIALKILE